MTTTVDICNRALQSFGSRTTVTALQLANNSKNEAIQFNLCYQDLRDQLLRMAPWNCGLKTANLVYITSTPGTPENMSPATNLWEPGQPPQPWAYEYQYPVDCLRPCWVIPQTQTGYAGVPITTAVTGGTPAFWQGVPIKYKVQIDQFYPVTAAAPANGGAGYVVGEIVTLPLGPNTEAPIGAPAKIRVLTVNLGAILTCEPVNQVLGSNPPQGGSYFAPQTNPVAQASSTGAGVGATFNLTFGEQSSQRVILTNQEFATLGYVKQVTDINLMDPLFIEAWVQIIAAKLCFQLSGDKTMANMCVELANRQVIEARKADGNEGLTVNDVTPDFIRIRGVNYTEGYGGPYYQGWEWGPTFAAF